MNMADKPILPAAAAARRIQLAADRDADRADRWIAAQVPDLSRARWQALMKDGRVTVNGRPCKPSGRIRRGDIIEVHIPAPEPVDLVAEPIALDILYEDSDILVINKPPGLVVHPAPGHPRGTLVNALLHHCRDLDGIGGQIRPGIVHRLDRDTSGALVVAKNQRALDALAAQFKRRQVRKVYRALAWGCFKQKSGTLETLIGRDPHNRKKMSARVSRGRVAVTRYNVLREYEEVSLIEAVIETGRTHQIRVHLAHLGHPVVGDRQYGRARASKRHIVAPRQMLHAYQIAFTHPRTGKTMEFTAPMPADMRGLLQAVTDGQAAQRTENS